MLIDWQKEAEARQEEMIADLIELLKIDSVRDDEKATKDAPVGPGPRDALLKFLEIAERDGFETKNVDNLAGHLVHGAGDETMGVFAHVDVVPTGSGWETDPFDPVIEDGKIYARGASDDKGPGIAGYYAIKIIKDLGLPVSKKVKFIIGTDEESGWTCMDRYLEVEPKPDFGFSPDAEFPIINGEKGMATIHANFKGSNGEGTFKLLSFDAGLRENMVPQDARAVFTAPDPMQVEKAFFAFFEENPVTGVVIINQDRVELEMVGQAAHAMEPRSGKNAGTYLATFLKQYDFGGDAKSYIDVIANYLHEDSRAEKLGIAYTDQKMGDLTLNPGVFTFTPETGGSVALNIRFPQGVTIEGLEIKLSEKLAKYGVTLARGKHQEPHYVPASDPLVQTLLDVYEKHTGQKGTEKTIGGGTYGRLIERGVAYGALFPGREDTMHQANEFMWGEDIVKATAVYADAIYRLIC